MTKFNLSFIIFFPFFILSCNDNQSDVKLNNTDSINTSLGEGTVSIPINKIEIIGLQSISFVKYLEDNVTLKLSLELKNSTPNKITTLNLKGYLKTEYKDGSIIFYPGDKLIKSEEEYVNLGIYMVNAVCKEEISKENPWRSGESKIFDLSLPGWGKHSNLGLLTSAFERTPETAEFCFSYLGISIDNEFKDTGSFNVLDNWKDFQNKLGLR